MSELASSQKIPANSSSANNNKNTGLKNTDLQKSVSNEQVNSVIHDDFVASADKQNKNRFTLSNEDVFKSAGTDKNTLNKESILPQNEKRALPLLNIYITSQQKVMNPLTQIQTRTHELINGFMSRYVDITDKLAAVWGEREKDIRERLSDTFKRIEVKVYGLFEKVDTSMEQKDHHKEKKIRDPEKRETDKDSKTYRVDNSGM